MNTKRRIAAGIGTAALVAVMALSGSQAATAAGTAHGAIEVCNGESLSTNHQDGVPLTSEEIAIGSRTLHSYCTDSTQIRPLGTTYGNYVRNVTNAQRADCSCGPSYQTWSIDINAVGVPYGSNNLNLIWRVEPGSGVWEYGPSIGITTYGSLPTTSGTMPLGSAIQSYGAVALNGTVLESVYNVAADY